jgi:hypothetical protein
MYFNACVMFLYNGIPVYSAPRGGKVTTKSLQEAILRIRITFQKYSYKLNGYYDTLLEMTGSLHLKVLL